MNQNDAGSGSLRKVVVVNASRDVAWRVFTEKMGTWWPLGTHKIGRVEAVDAVIEPTIGGRWYECGADGSTCDWGRVLVWEPPSRLVLTWDIGADWQHDEQLNTEVEVRFVPEGPETTRVELIHSHLDRYGPRRDEMRGIFDSEQGWTGLLAAFAASAAQGGKP